MTLPPGLEGWEEPFPGVPTMRYLERAVAVFVDISRALPGSAAFTRADALPLRVRAGGIQLEGRMPGELHCWLRIADGRWLGQVCVPARSANRQAHLDLWLWVDASNIAPRSM